MRFHSFRDPRHPFPSPAHLTVWLLVTALLVGWVSAAASGIPDDKPKKKKQPIAEQFLVFGTVFDARGFAYHGAEIRIRRAGEKKVAGEATSDSRGEFGIRVPTGAEYDLSVQAKGFHPETRKIDARARQREDLVIRLQPAVKGEKK